MPLPEDVVMLLVGYISAVGIVKFPIAVLVAFVAILCADFALYYLSLTGTKFALMIERRVKANIFSWYADRMRKHAFPMIFVSRFIPGIRFLGPIVAGYVKLKPATFFLYSLCSAVVYVPITITIGFLFHEKITPLIGAVQSTRHAIFIVILLVLAIALSILVHRKLFKKKGENSETRDILVE
ncbi:MAG: DedA family protein [Patescibacteria group bacterium]